MNKLNFENGETYLDPEKKEGKVLFYEFLSETKSDKLYNELLKDLPWEHGVYKMYGKDWENFLNHMEENL